MKVGHGIFGWCSTERRSDRYGSIHLSSSPFDGGPVADLDVNLGVLLSLEGRRVKITCKVVEARKSSHLGDLFHKIFPTTPEVGEEIEIGVGELEINKGYDGSPDIVLRPNDGRETLWIDPRILYRLHDQTVDVFVEETDEPFSPAPDLSRFHESEAIVEDNGDIQVKNVEGAFRIEPEITSLGSGLSRIEIPKRSKVSR